MKGEVVRRVPQYEVRRDRPDLAANSAGNLSKTDEFPDKDKKDGRRKSPMVAMVLIFALMCALSAYFGAKVVHLTSSSGIKNQSKNSSDQMAVNIRSRVTGDASSSRLKVLELEVQSIMNQSAVSCHASIDAKSYDHINLCTAEQRVNDQIVVYNPSNHDKFICNGRIILGPKKLHVLNNDNLDDCWKRPIQTLLMAHSFPLTPTFENRGMFPGIVVEATPSTKNGYDETFSSDFISQRTLLSSKDGSRPECDVKCDFEPLSGINQHRYIYGTEWRFIMSMEGEKYYPELMVDTTAWKNNKFYATTSFKSEIPLPYFSFAEYNIQNDAVSFKDAIKGASFLARNCDSLNNREEVVKSLMSTSFRVDSLSSCLNNVDNPGFDLGNKGEVMKKYLFHLAFENQNTDDYITEKLWGTLSSGTVPVYFGAPNVKDHVPFNGVIFVDDFPTIEALADHLLHVSSDQKLYESYHTWRNEPLPKAFLAKYNISRTHSQCRTCRWAHARKYGLGWNHASQMIESVSLSREACVQSNRLTSPVTESWAILGYEHDNEVRLNEFGLGESLCPLAQHKISRSSIGNGELIRTIWRTDAATDIYVEGDSSNSYILRLAFSFQIDHRNTQLFTESNVVWIQNKNSRISLAFNLGPGRERKLVDIVSMKPGMFEVRIDPDMLPLRVRIIVEDLNLLQEGAEGELTYYGKMMSNDIVEIPQLFSITGAADQPALRSNIRHMSSANLEYAHKKRSGRGGT